MARNIVNIFVTLRSTIRGQFEDGTYALTGYGAPAPAHPVSTEESAQLPD